ncbi:chromate transporter [bacterium]|nr:chromate transporter [bacterium]
MKIYILLFIEFFKIGILSLGGGYATIPFLYQLINDYGWYTTQQLSDMIAISILTPGPVGINMATFAGYKTIGVSGAILASISLVIPSYIIVIVISKIMIKLKDNFYIKAILDILKPTGCGLLTVVGIKFCKDYITDIYSLLLLTTLFIISYKFKKNPLYYFLIGGVSGILIHLFFPNSGI